MNQAVSICVFLLSVLISSISQIILKYSASKEHKSVIDEYSNKEVIFAYFLFGLSTLLTIFAYRNIAMNLGPVLEATGYIYILGLSYVFFKERMSFKQVIGIIFIIVGIIVYSLG